MSLVSAVGRYLSSDSHFLTVAVSPFPGIQSDAEAHAAETGFIDVRILDSRDLEDGEYLPTPTPQVFPDLDDPYAIVHDPLRQPSSSTPLPARLPQVAPLSQYFLLMDINGVLLATFFGIIGKEKVNSMHTRVKEKKSKKGPYLTYQLWPFLKGLKESRLPVPVYCRQNSLFESTRLFPGDEGYERYKTVIPRDQRGFEVPYVGPHIPGAPYTNVGGPSIL
jgi:hypothetical protein